MGKTRPVSATVTAEINTILQRDFLLGARKKGDGHCTFVLDYSGGD